MCERVMSPNPEMEVDKSEYIEFLSESLSRTSGGSKLVHGNKVRYLKDARENFPAWIEGIKAAREFICIEMYIWERKNFGAEIRDLLLEKLKEGVRVYICYDWFGSLAAHYTHFFRPLRAAGAEVLTFNKPNLFSGLGIISRDHRKSIVVDGCRAYVSGLCFSSAWAGNPEKGIPAWRDSGLELAGPVVAEVLKAFEETRSTLTGTPFTEKYEVLKFDPERNRDLVDCRVIATSKMSNNMIRLDLLGITVARRSIWITDAYFMPTKMYLQLLSNAARDGVDVRILVPRSSDIPWIASVSRTLYRGLLEAGVRIYEWNGSMIHAKTLVIDGLLGRVGSTNLNLSSWFANSELDIVLEGEKAVAPLVAAFLEDLRNATEIILGSDKAAHPAKTRQKLSASERRQFTNMQSKAIVRQLTFLGKNINDILRGSPAQYDVVDGPEFWSLLSIALFFLLLAVLFGVFPKIIAYPLVFLLASASLLTGYRAYQTLKIMIRNKKQHKDALEALPPPEDKSKTDDES